MYMCEYNTSSGPHRGIVINKAKIVWPSMLCGVCIYKKMEEGSVAPALSLLQLYMVYVVINTLSRGHVVARHLVARTTCLPDECQLITLISLDTLSPATLSPGLIYHFCRC